MTYEVKATSSFEQDVIDVANYLALSFSSPSGIDRLINELERIKSIFAATPFLNAISNKSLLKKRSYREHYILNYVIVYRIENDVVYLIRLFHQRQNYENLIY